MEQQNLTLVINAVQNDRTRRAPDNGSASVADRSRVRGAELDRNTMTNRQDNRRSLWTDRLDNDLLSCYDTSTIPNRRGYMARLHTLWCQKHPEFSHLSQQVLRNRAVNLSRTRDVRGTLPQPLQEQAAEEDEEATLRPTAEIRLPLRDDGNLRTRRNINIQVPPKPHDLAEMDATLREDFSEDSDLWTISCSVYDAARALADSNRRSKPTIDEKTEKRLHQLNKKID